MDRVIKHPVIKQVDVPVYKEQTVQVPKDVYVDKIIKVDKYEDVEVEKVIEKQIEI